MTVNERLAVAGLVDRFDEAVAQKNEDAVRRILAQVFLSEANIEGVLRQVLRQDIITRPGRLTDARDAHALLRSCLEGMRRSGIDQWDELYPTEQVLLDDLGAGAMLVVERAGRVVGAATLNDNQEVEYKSVAWAFVEGRSAVVHRLMIEPSLQRTGLGKTLMGAVEDRARNQGFSSIRLDAFAGNPGALRLYRSMGYREAGTVRFRKGLFLCFEKRLENLAPQ